MITDYNKQWQQQQQQQPYAAFVRTPAAYTSTTSLLFEPNTQDQGIVVRRRRTALNKPSNNVNGVDQVQATNNQPDRRSWKYIVGNNNNNNDNDGTRGTWTDGRQRPSSVLVDGRWQTGIVTLELVKGATGFGFGLTETREGHVIKHISDPSRCSAVKVNDRIVSLDGVSVEYLSHADVVAILREKMVGSVTKFTFYRDTSLNERQNRILTSCPVEQSRRTQSAVHTTNVSPRRISTTTNGVPLHPAYAEEFVTAGSYNTSSLPRSKNLVTIMSVPLNYYPPPERFIRTESNIELNASNIHSNNSTYSLQRPSARLKNKSAQPRSEISVAHNNRTRPQSSILVARDNCSRPQSSQSSVFFSGTPDFVPASVYQCSNSQESDFNRSISQTTVSSNQHSAVIAYNQSTTLASKAIDNQTLDMRKPIDNQTLDNGTLNSHSKVLRKTPNEQRQTGRPKSAIVARTVTGDSQSLRDKRSSDTTSTGITFYPRHVQSSSVADTVTFSCLPNDGIDSMLSTSINNPVVENKSKNSNGVSGSLKIKEKASTLKHLTVKQGRRTYSQTDIEYDTRRLSVNENTSGDNVTRKIESESFYQNSSKENEAPNEKSISSDKTRNDSGVSDLNLEQKKSTKVELNSSESGSVIETRSSQPAARRLGTFFEGSIDRRRDSTTPRYRGDHAVTSQTEHGREALAKEHQFRVKLFRGSRGFGFAIKGGWEFARTPISILSVAPGEAADKDGQLKKDDQVIEINGYSTVEMTNTRATELIRDSSSPIRLTLYRAPQQQIRTAGVHPGAIRKSMISQVSSLGGDHAPVDCQSTAHFSSY